MKLTTHRIIQISQIQNSVEALARQFRRAAINAASIKNRTMAIRFTNRAQKCDSIAFDCARRLARSDMGLGWR